MAKLAFFAAAWVQGLASRTEGSSMLQVSEHIQVDSQRMEYLNNVKQQILSLAANGVPEETKTVLSSVSEMLTGQVLPAILTERSNEEANHNTVFSQFATATTTYDAAVAAATTFLDGEVTNAKTTHSNCRGPEPGSESDAYGLKTDCDGQQVIDQSDYESDEGAVSGLSQVAGVCVDSEFEWRSPSETPATTLAAMKKAAEGYAEAIGQVIVSRGALELKIAECTGLNGDYVTKKASCDSAQRTFETKSCSYTAKVTDAVVAYTNRYGEITAEFEGLWGGWDASSLGRETQCRLVKTLVCYIDGLKANDDSGSLTAAVAACDTKRDTHNCADVTFAHSATPAADDMAATPTSPCEDGFHYVDTWPAGTAAAKCHVCA